MNNAPLYDDIDLTMYDPTGGFYTYGIIKQHFPKVHIIDTERWFDEGLINDSREVTGFNHTWLVNEINENLKINKIVFVMIDGDYLYTTNSDPFVTNLVTVLNQYIDSCVYLIEEADSFGVLRKEYGVKCKTLEIPWVLLNDALCYVNNSKPCFYSSSKHNYISFANKIKDFRVELAESLYANGLAKYGLITFRQEDFNKLPNRFKRFCAVSETHEYPNQNFKNHVLYRSKVSDFATNSSIKVDDIWVSPNVINYLHLKETNETVPLVVHSETCTSKFPNTEKSLWPILLGKLFLVFGRPGTMAWIQRFYDIDISSYADLTFDSYKKSKIYNYQLIKENNVLLKDYHREVDKRRINDLVVKNKDLIKDASYVYKELKPELEKASKTFGKNLYEFFISQIESVYK